MDEMRVVFFYSAKKTKQAKSQKDWHITAGSAKPLVHLDEFPHLDPTIWPFHKTPLYAFLISDYVFSGSRCSVG